LYFIRPKCPQAYEVGMPMLAFIKSISAVYLRIALIRNDSTIQINPMYYTLFSIVMYSISISMCNGFMTSSILTFVFSGISLTLQIK
jgi:uncharacterized membrane protein YGL010W